MSIDDSFHEALGRTFGTLTAGLATVAVAFSLVCCTKPPAPARHTVAEYQENPELRRQQVARCADDPGTLRDAPDCINARQATVLEDNRPVRDLPPVRLPPPPDRPPDRRRD
jgi:hypothetical protein